jgi:hypothetical protein
VIEQSAVVWHSSLLVKNRKDLERVQKAAIKVILGRKYTTHKDSLKFLKNYDLKTRRKKLYLSFAKKNVLSMKRWKTCSPWGKLNTKWKQAGAELCQAQAQVGLPTEAELKLSFMPFIFSKLF